MADLAYPIKREAPGILAGVRGLQHGDLRIRKIAYKIPSTAAPVNTAARSKALNRTKEQAKKIPNFEHYARAGEMASPALPFPLRA